MKQTWYKLANVGLFISNVIFIGFNTHFLCKEYPNNSNLGFDYMGVIAGILSLLVTILLGWQIFSIININRIKNDVLEKRIRIYMETEESKIELHGSLCDFYIAQLEKSFSNIVAFRYIINQLYLIIALVHVKDIERYHQHISILTEKLGDLKIEIPKRQYDMILTLIKEAAVFDKNNDLITALQYIKISSPSK